VTDRDPETPKKKPDEDPKKPPSDPSLERENPNRSWIQKLAERSAGLPSAEREKPAAKDPGVGQLWRFAGLGIQFAATVGIFTYIGYEIDKWRGWKNNVALLTLVLIAVVGNLYLLIKEAMKANK
jgi:hypothetical protein